ncbi:hypothetical protein AB0H17_07510 [Streptomyces olivoreticuli]
MLFTDLMSGCGMRNGGVAAVNLNNIAADEVYRIAEQVNQTTRPETALRRYIPLGGCRMLTGGRVAAVYRGRGVNAYAAAVRTAQRVIANTRRLVEAVQAA